MSLSRLFPFLCLSFILGIFLNSLGILAPYLLMGGGLILGIFLISVFWKYQKSVAVGLCFLFLVWGIWWHHWAVSEIHYPEEREVTFTGFVAAEPDIRDEKTILTIKALKKLTSPTFFIFHPSNFK